MGLFDKIKSAFVSEDGTPVPPVASFAVRSDVVYAPVSGMLVSLEEVNDSVISGGLLGDGYGVLPVGSGVVYSPISGRVKATNVTNHSIGVATDDGIDVLIHIGIGTVNMNGKGFVRFVEANQEVKAGEPLISFDTEAIRAAGYDDVVVCVVSNPDDFARINHVAESGTLLGGRPLVKVGDPLLMVTR